MCWAVSEGWPLLTCAWEPLVTSDMLGSVREHSHLLASGSAGISLSSQPNSGHEFHSLMVQFPELRETCKDWIDSSLLDCLYLATGCKKLPSVLLMCHEMQLETHLLFRSYQKHINLPWLTKVKFLMLLISDLFKQWKLIKMVNKTKSRQNNIT